MSLEREIETVVKKKHLITISLVLEDIFGSSI
jgi:hypothetical protein